MRTSEMELRAVLRVVLMLCLWSAGACRPAPAVQTTDAPGDAIQVEITTRKGTWAAVYATETKECDGRLVIPAGRPVAVKVVGSHGTQRMCAQELGLDQSITASAPYAFWFQLGEPKRHALGQGCPEGGEPLEGTFHVVETSDWDAWLRSGDCAPLDPAADDYGERLFTRLGCSSCHSMDGSRGVGPPLDGLIGRKESLVDGTEVVVDAAYVRASILRPSAQVVRGYAPTMPDLGESLSGAQLDALVEYLTGPEPKEGAVDEP